MEQNTETKTLSFSKGMTNIPSDNICTDDELMESVGFIYRDGEMKPIQKPVCITGDTPLEGKLVYVHKLADYRNLITYVEDKKQLVCYVNFKNGETEKREENKQTIDLGAKLLDVKSVGNTLVCATDKGLHYLLYKGNEYKNLGNELPKPVVRFYFSDEEENTELEKDRTVCRIRTFISDVTTKDYGYLCYDEYGNFLGVKDSYDGAAKYALDTHHIMNTSDTEKYDNFQNAVKGHVAEAIEYTKKNNLFAFPFFIRTALRLFDGTTFARISNPIICYPSSKKNCKFGPCYYDSDKKTWVVRFNGNAPRDDASWQYMLILNYSHLNFKIEIPNKEDWADIIKEFVVFASDDVLPFEIDSDWSFKTVAELDGKVYYDGVRIDRYIAKKITFHWDTYQARELIEPIYKTERKIIDELLGKSQFYKLFSFELDSEYLDNKWHDASAFDETVSDIRIMPEGRLSNLKEQEQLKVDDYYGWTHIISNKLFSYNNRLNSFGIKRVPFEGFNQFLAVQPNTSTETYRYLVHIVSDTMDRWVESDYMRYSGNASVYDWLYYPDPNAKEMMVTAKNNTKGVLYKLTSHPYLNGAYSFTKLASAEYPSLDTNLPAIDSEAYEYLDSQIFTSVVNNPFVFEASGDNTVGTGKILGIVANTEAVSQGQFGQYPLLVFTSEGIYGMSVNSEGLYSATYPISREVCLENSPLVPTDRLIFFASKKGLMAASGGSVACVSEQLRGRQADPMQYYRLEEGPISLNRVADLSIAKFLVDSFVAYDYRDSLLRIFAKDKSYQYIYNMVDHTFAVDNSGIMAQAVVNDYPDNLIQDADGNVYSLTNKPDINDDENLYSGAIITRPMKLGSSMILKSLREIRNIRKTTQGKLTLKVLANNNAGQNWCQLTSLLGKPWAYFTFEYTLTDFKASDSFQGSVVVIQNRRSLLRGQN